MSNAVRFPLATLNAMLLGILHSIDAAGVPGSIVVYGNATLLPNEPVPVGAITLVTYELKYPAGTVTNGVLTLTPPDEAMCSGDGRASAARVFDGGGSAIFDLTVGDMSSGAGLRLGQLNLYAGASLLRPTIAKISGV